MISQTVEYALRAIVTIAQHEGVPCTAQKIAEITQVPAPYLSKMMQGMARANLVVSKRGLHGGFVLTKDATETTILDVIEAVEPFQRIRECPLGIGSHEGALCPLHRRLDNAMETVEASFREATIAELLSQPGSISPLCDEGQIVTIDLASSSTDTATKTSTPRKPKQKK